MPFYSLLRIDTLFVIVKAKGPKAKNTNDKMYDYVSKLPFILHNLNQIYLTKKKFKRLFIFFKIIWSWVHNKEGGEGENCLSKDLNCSLELLKVFEKKLPFCGEFHIYAIAWYLSFIQIQKKLYITQLCVFVIQRSQDVDTMLHL